MSLSADAATYYVSPIGQNTQPGTELLPWRTLRKGLQRLKPGDTLYVRGGDYFEVLGAETPIDIHPATSEAPITVRNYPGERPVVRGLLQLERPSYWTVDGINVTWKFGQPSNRHMVKFTDGVGWTYKNAEVWGSKGHSGILVAGSLPNEPDNWRIAYCVVHDTHSSNDTNQDHLLYINTGLAAGQGVIERNILYNATNGHGIKLGSWYESEGSANVTIRYNTFYNTVSAVFIPWASANNRVYRNMFEKALGRGIFVRGYQLTGTGNVAFENAGHESNHFVLSDAGYQPIEATNNVRILPSLPKVLLGHTILNPANGLSQYGRYADPPDP